MRINESDCYKNISVIGTDIYDIIFARELISSQNVKTWNSSKATINEKDLNILKKIINFFAFNPPMLIDEKKLREIFLQCGISSDTLDLHLNSKDLIEQISKSVDADAVYVCNAKGINKQTMFTIGYLMANNQEVFFWDKVNDSEYLISSILDKSGKKNYGINDIVSFPLDFVRTISYPYLMQEKINKNFGVSRNTEFNVPIEDCKIIPNSICLLGSLRKHLNFIKNKADIFTKKGYTILAPKMTNVQSDNKGFIIFEDDIDDNPIIIEGDFLSKCMSSEKIVVCNKEGYCGNTVMFELGYLLGKGKKIDMIESPKEDWIREVVNYYNYLNDELDDKDNRKLLKL